MKSTCFLSIAIFLASCTSGLDDLDVLGVKSPGWEESFASSAIGLESETELQMENSGLEMRARELLDIDKSELSLEDFFDAEQSYFPIYPKDLRSFSLVTYKELCSDSSSIHLESDALLSYVDSLLKDEVPYRVYRQTWNYHGTPISTLSLYNDYDELAYDNIQFNMITVRQLRYDGTRRRMLSRSEGPYAGCIDSGVKEVKFYNRNNDLVAWTNFWWEEYGHMESAPLYRSDTIFAINYHYVHDYLDYGSDFWTYNNYLSTINRFVDLSSNTEGRFSLCLWAGPNSERSRVNSEVDLYFNYPFVAGNYYDISRFLEDYSWYSCRTDGFFLSKEMKLEERVVPVE